MDAPGLNEKAGRAGDLGLYLSLSTVASKDGLCVSIADRGLLPVARENEEGADEEDGRAGKTNGGFGGGAVPFGEAIELENEPD